MGEQPMNVREILQGRTIVKVCPEGADGSEFSLASEIMLELDNGMQLTIYPAESCDLCYSAIHRDNA